MPKSKVFWISQTGVLLALLVAAQAVTKPMGQIVTGSCVNGILAVSTWLVGLSGGLSIALISPFVAFLLGIGPAVFPLTPIIAVGNCVYVVLLHLLGGQPVWKDLAAVAVSAFCKFLVLYLLVVQVVCRVLPLKPPQIQTFTAMFSWPQLITALIGGVLAVILVPAIRKALHKS